MNIMLLIDEMFWKIGFKTETEAEKRLLFALLQFFNMISFFQYDLNLGITYRDKRAEIAQSVKSLGDKFPSSSSHALWLAEMHPDRLCCRAASAAASSTGQGTLIVPDDK
jgi:hypothetical protein